MRGLGRLFVLIVLAMAAAAPQTATPKLPLVTPSVTTLGTVDDASPNGDQLPREAALSPDGHLIAFMTGPFPYGDMRIRNADARTQGSVISTRTHDYRWGATNGTLVLTRFDPALYSNQVWTVRVDPRTGLSVAPLFRVSASGATHAAALSPDGQWVAFCATGVS